MKGKKSVSIKHIIFLCAFMLVSMIGILNLCFMNTVAQAETGDKNTKEKKERFVVDSKARIGNYVRRNEDMELVTTVTNNEEDFTGFIQAIMINEEGKNVMYQTDLVLAAGETKTVSQEMRWTNNSSRIMVHITDKKENILAKKKVKVSMLTEEQCLIGILSDEKQELGYWDSEKVAYLSKEDISSFGMNVIDVLLINNFNTGDLEKEQYEAVKEWVEHGGTLIVGTGEQVNRTLAMFQDDYLSGRIGNAKQGIADISFQGEKITDDIVDDIVLHKVEKGLGVICVANKNLGIDKSAWGKKGYEYINAIKRQYSTVLQERLENGTDYYGYSYYGFGADSILRGANEIPSIKNFAIVLCIYIILITVGAFLVLKKKDKLEWTWGVIPVIGVIFAGVIIVIGSKTRISGTYMNYTQIMEFQEEGNSNIKNITYMDVASSNNADYEIVVPEKTQVYAKSAFNYYDDDYDNEGYDDYNIGFITKDNKKIIALKNNQAFETSKLVSESEETLDGNYQSDMHYLNATLSGTFINETGFTIKNAVLWTEQKLYKLGTIKPGEKVEITNKTPFTLYTYSYGQQSNYYKILGVNPDKQKWSLEEARYVDALDNVFQNYTDSGRQKGVVYGYMDTDDAAAKERWGIKSYGISLVKFPIKISYRADNGEIYVPDIVTEGQCIKGSYYSGDHTAYLDEDLVIEYTLEENERLTGIYFSELLNPSINKSVGQYYGELYEGEIEAYNWETKKYEAVFKTDQEGEVTDVEKYVGKGNIVRIRMSAENKEEGDVYVPVISITKEVKKNG
ncbi:MAG: YrzE family protein [Lachnospiraceae bacterium]|nr:YrzE family protein [Lachnospiraceae bacterium]